MSKIISLNPVNIDTNYSIAPSTPGFSTVALLNNADVDQPKLEKFSALNQMTNYDPNSYQYEAASAYFNGGDENNLFEVISGEESVNTGRPQSHLKQINDELTNHKTSIGTHNPVDVLDDILPELKADNANGYISDDFYHGKASNLPDSVKPFDFSKQDDNFPDYAKVYGATNGYPVDIDGVGKYIDYIYQQTAKEQVAKNSNSNGLVDALRKYYNSGAEYFLFNVDNNNDSDKQTAIQLAQLVEDQSNGVIIIDVKTADDHPDLSWTKPLDQLKSEMTVSLPGDDMLGADLLAVRASQSPRANIEFINSLPDITGQAQYDFTIDDYNKYYRPYNVATYCNRNGRAMLTDGDSGSGYQLSNMITRDYLNYQIINNITNLLTKNNGDPGIPYNPQGVSLITNQLRLVLSEAARKNYINSYNINPVDFNKIPQEELAKGQLNGLSYNWAPTQNVTGVTFHQNIQMPNLNA